MADTPAFGVRFHPYRPLVVVREAEPAEGEPVRVYQLALELASRAYRVLERAESERYFLRDQLDRKTAVVPQLVAQALALADMAARRANYQRAREIVTDCAAILDVLLHRDTIPRELLEAARVTASALLDELAALVVPPPRVW